MLGGAASASGTSGRPFSTSSPRPGRLAPRRYIEQHDQHEDHELRARRGSAAPPEVGNHDRFETSRISDSMIPSPIPAGARDPERGEPREQRGRQRRHDLQRQRLGVELGDRRREDPDAAGDQPTRAACWPATARSARARAASPRPRSRRPRAWPGRSATTCRAPTSTAVSDDHDPGEDEAVDRDHRRRASTRCSAAAPAARAAAAC